MRTGEPPADAARHPPLPDVGKFLRPGVALTTPARPPLSRNPRKGSDVAGKFLSGGACGQDSVEGRELKAGNTPLREEPALSRYLGVGRLLIKDESHNPFGTHKDRKSDYVLENVERLSRGWPVERLCILTCGNAGLSLAAFAAKRRLPVTAFIDAPTPSLESRLEMMGARVVRVEARKRIWSTRELRRRAGATSWRNVLDVTNMFRPYYGLAEEIALARPDVVVLPVGGGELFVGLARRLGELGLPARLIGITASAPRTAADKLYAWWSPFRGRLQELTRSSGPHRLLHLSNEQSLTETYRAVSRYLRCEPSSAAAFDVLRRLSFRPHEKVLVINTGTFLGDDRRLAVF